MTDNPTPISIRFSYEFEKQLYRLSKKYRNIRADLEPITQELQTGKILGDRLIGFGANEFIYKLRIKNSNLKKGKSSGYRLIYFLRSETTIFLLTIYSKSEQQNITVNDLKAIIHNLSDDN